MVHVGVGYHAGERRGRVTDDELGADVLLPAVVRRCCCAVMAGSAGSRSLILKLLLGLIRAGH
jgi:hypothetical protein